MDWSEFKREVNVVSYMEYMMRRNKISSILSDLLEYMRRFDPEDNYFKHYQISEVYALIKRREGRGKDLIGYLCSMLTNDWKMKLGLKLKRLKKRLVRRKERGYIGIVDG